MSFLGYKFGKLVVMPLAMVGAVASAQGITPMEFEPQATMLAPKGVLTSCGIGFDGVVPLLGSPGGIEQVSGSIAIYTDGLTLVKVGHQYATLKNGALDVRLPGTQVAWLRIEGEAPLAPEEKMIVQGEKAPFFLFPVTAKDGAAAIFAMLEGKTIWVAFSRSGTVRQIFSGKVKVDPVVQGQIRTCFNEWTRSQPPAK